MDKEQNQLSQPTIISPQVGSDDQDTAAGRGPEPRRNGGPRPGDLIGDYRVVKPLGSGGMGVVFEADQLVPIQRRVAIKLVHANLASDAALRRFARERQALAVMNHRSIAKIFDAGATENGQPFVVMELVEGIPITDYCDQQRLNTRQRVSLAVALCYAVQHAHQKGILHRDLKPTNVLVTHSDSGPTPKVIDFGIAKAIDELEPEGALTAHGNTVGTPAYMSPEQMGIADRDVDTRSDVFALGVILYETLVGALPWDQPLAGARALMARMKAHQSPLPPASQRLSSFNPETASLVAERRATDPGTLRKALVGDLDHILLKAIAPDRKDRYPSASEMAQDLQRYLAHEPVSARPANAAYRIGKLSRKHRVVATAMAVALLAITIGGAAAATGLIQARRAERLAAVEAEAAQRVSAFLGAMFEEADPFASTQDHRRGTELTAGEILKRSVERLSTLNEQPEIRARLMDRLGIVYRNLGELDRAEPLLLDALVLRQDVLGTAHVQTVESEHELAVLRHSQGEFEAAERGFEQVLAQRRVIYGNEHSEVAIGLHNLAMLRVERGAYSEAIPLYEEALAMKRRLMSEDSYEVLVTLGALASAYRRVARHEEAEVLYRKTLRLQRQLAGDEHPDTSRTMLNLANFLTRMGRFSEAEPLHREALSIRRATLDSQHPDLAISLHSLATLLRSTDRLETAEPLYREALAIHRFSLGDDHPFIARHLAGIAATLHEMERLEEAEPLYREALARRLRDFDEAHPETAALAVELARLVLDRGNARAAETRVRAAFATLVTALPEGHAHRAEAQVVLGRSLAQQRKFEAAEPLLTAGYASLQRLEREATPTARRARAALISLYETWPRPEKLAELLDAAG